MERVQNAGGFGQDASGFQYDIDSLSYIRSGVVGQKFYKVAPAEYMPVDVGEGAWADETVQNLSVDLAGSFYEGDIDTATGNGRLSQVGAAVTPIRMPNVTWAKAAQWTITEIAKASRGNWDVVENRLKSLKTNWDLGIQRTAFLGHPTVSDVTGLLNASQVTINTTLITGTISAMNEGAFQTFVANVLTAFFANSQSTELPDTFVIPTDDYLGLGTAASATYPNISKIEYLENMFQKATSNPGFEIKPLAYGQSTQNNLGQNRYVLYRNDPETLKMSIPFDLNIIDPDSADGFYMQQTGYGQYSGVLVNRGREMLYIDRQ